MTGFLCALGGVCLQRRSPSRPLSGLPLPEPKKGSTKQYQQQQQQHQQQDNVSCLSSSSQEVQYCPVTQFVYNLLRLLICNNEKFGLQVTNNLFIIIF